MAAKVESGKIQTVLGWIEPSALGVTLTHEHLSLVFPTYIPAKPEERQNETMPFNMANLGWIRQNPDSHKENLRMYEEHAAIMEEMKLFKQKGGNSLVECTINGIDRDLQFSKEVATANGINVIAGSGYYVDLTHPADMDKKTVEEIAGEMRADITEGCDGTDIRCGVIGELGCTWPLTANEKKVLQAAGSTQADLGAPVIIHPGRNHEAPAEIIRVLQEAGGDINKTVMSHLDRTFHEPESLLEFASLGSYCEYDLFGMQESHYQLNLSVDMPSDAERIRRIKTLVDGGYEDKILIAHDMHTKHRLVKFGGHGYCHIFDNIVPKMLDRGLTQQHVDKILIHNPKAWLTFK